MRAIRATVPGHGSVMYRMTPGSVIAVGATRELVGSSSGRCLDVFDNATAPGTGVELCDRDGGTGQEWAPTTVGELRVYGGSQCLDAYGAGTEVELWTCNGGTNQQWRLNPDGSVTGVGSGLCPDVTGGNTSAGNVNGAAIEWWGCDGSANQRWSLH